MINEEFRLIDASELPISKLITIIAKCQSFYLNNMLNESGINSTQLRILFEISHQNNINQEKIAARCSINKGAVARSIKKLEDMGLVIREIDENNRRQNKVSLTQKGEELLNKSIKILNDLEQEVFDDETINKEELQNVLKEITIKIMEITEREVKN